MMDFCWFSHPWKLTHLTCRYVFDDNFSQFLLLTFVFVASVVVAFYGTISFDDADVDFIKKSAVIGNYDVSG